MKNRYCKLLSVRTQTDKIDLFEITCTSVWSMFEIAKVLVCSVLTNLLHFFPNITGKVNRRKIND
jgi:hypothetical protein